MKQKTLIFTLILTMFYFLNLLIFEQNASIIPGSIVSSLVVGIVTFLLMRLLLLPIQRSSDNIISDIINKHSNSIAYASMNHVKKYFINSTGGVGCLYKDKLVFIPHSMNLSRKGHTLFFHEIESVLNYRACGVFDIGLKIVLKSGKTEKYVIDKASQLYKDLFRIVHTV